MSYLVSWVLLVGKATISFKDLAIARSARVSVEGSACSIVNQSVEALDAFIDQVDT